MEIKWLNDINVLPTSEPLLAAISHDESIAYVGLIDEGVEHHILLSKIKGNSNDLDKYYRIVFDNDGADWTFVCPNDYKGITNKEKRIETFYNEGYSSIRKFLVQIGYPDNIEIPKRYKRHFDYMTNDEF